MTNFDDMKFAVEAMSGGKNTVILDDLGMPSIMVVVPKMDSANLITGATSRTHPAFIVGSATKEKAYISKYINITVNDRAYSLPMQDPRASITFDSARTMCKNKGTGWCLTPNALWSAIALWSKKNGTLPHGNNQWGHDVTHTHETGVATTYETGDSHKGEPAHTATGSGPATWTHDHTPEGICDMNGNVWEWCDGLRLSAGEIQVIPNADCVLHNTDVGATSSAWKAISATGALTTPSASGTLKYDFVSSHAQLCSTVTVSADAWRDGGTFESMTKHSSISAVPQILHELALFPAETGYEGDHIYFNNAGERMAFRGGDWISGAYAGVFAVYLHSARTHSSTDIGFRSAFYE